ncbi:unnamed protein product [Calypogeia fissa]
MASIVNTTESYSTDAVRKNYRARIEMKGTAPEAKSVPAAKRRKRLVPRRAVISEFGGCNTECPSRLDDVVEEVVSTPILVADSEERSGLKCTHKQAQGEQEIAGESLTTGTSAKTEERTESKWTCNQADQDRERRDGEPESRWIQADQDREKGDGEPEWQWFQADQDRGKGDGGPEWPWNPAYHYGEKREGFSKWPWNPADEDGEESDGEPKWPWFHQADQDGKKRYGEPTWPWFHQADQDREKIYGEPEWPCFHQADLRSFQGRYQALRVDVLQRLDMEADIVRSLQSELDATRVALRIAKVKSADKLVEVEKELVSVKRERDAALCDLDELKAQLKLYARTKMCLQGEVSLQKTLYEKAGRDLTAKDKELENLRKVSEQTRLRGLEQAKCSFDALRLIFAEGKEILKKKDASEDELVS